MGDAFKEITSHVFSACEQQEIKTLEVIDKLEAWVERSLENVASNRYYFLVGLGIAPGTITTVAQARCVPILDKLEEAFRELDEACKDIVELEEEKD